MIRFELPPPYRLERAYDLEAFLATHPGINMPGWRELARKHVLVRPPIMAHLPEKFHADVKIMRQELAWQINYPALLAEEIEDVVGILADLKASVLAVSTDLADDYLEMARRTVAEGKALLREVTGKDRISGKESGQEYVHLRAVDGVYLLPDLFGEMLFYLLNRRNAKFARFLKDKLLACELYDRNFRLDRELLETIRSEPEDSVRLFLHLNTIISAIKTRRNHVFRPFIRKYLDTVEGKLMPLREPNVQPGSSPRALASLKSNVFAVLQEVAESCDEIGVRATEATTQLDRLYVHFTGKVSAPILEKFKSLTDNFLEKTRAFADFYSRHFFIEPMEKAARIFNRRVSTSIQTVSLFTGVRLWFYPCKDYMDYIKGVTSGDCTTDVIKAKEHLLHQRFFNIRIFSGQTEDGEEKLSWIGNIYCLDFTGDRTTLVIDRIQLSGEGRIFPQRFFPIFMEVLLNNLATVKELTILAPPRISNFPVVDKSFAAYCRNLPKTKFSFPHQDQRFECSRFSKFYVLFPSAGESSRLQNRLLEGQRIEYPKNISALFRHTTMGHDGGSRNPRAFSMVPEFPPASKNKA